MSKTEKLKTEITEAIRKIETLNENNKFEVYSIYSNIYKKCTDMNREDFKSEIEFDKHCSDVKSKYNTIQLELSNLQNPNSMVDVQSNFAQIKISLHNLI